MNIPFINEQMIRSNISMPKAIELMELAFSELSEKKAIIPIRTNMQMNHSNSLIMPVYSPSLDVYGVKIVSINPNNTLQNQPLIHAVFQLMEATTGKPLALFDAEYITALRTGAASGLASKLLSDPKSEILAIFGAGKQSLFQIEAVCNVRNISKVLVYTRTASRPIPFINDGRNIFSGSIICTENQSLLSDADIICTATTSKTPVIFETNLKPHVHINGIGSYQADMSEIPNQLVANSSIIVDQKEACLKEAGDIIQAINNGFISESDIYAELGKLINSNKIVKLQKKMTFFKSVGNAIQDLYIAEYIWKKRKVLND